MLNVAILSEELLVINVILCDDMSQAQSIYPDKRLMDVSELEVMVGQTYSDEHERFVPLNRIPGFIFNESLWKWIPPKPAPEDSTWTVGLEDEPEGHSELIEKKIYFWMSKYNDWGLAPCSCNPSPGNEYYWNPLDKEWQIPTYEKPGDGYIWNPIEKQWFEMPTLPEQL